MDAIHAEVVVAISLLASSQHQQLHTSAIGKDTPIKKHALHAILNQSLRKLGAGFDGHQHHDIMTCLMPLNT